MRLQVCGWRTVWGAAIDSTQQQQQQRQQQQKARRGGGGGERQQATAARSTRGAGVLLSSMGEREALAGPEGWRKCVLLRGACGGLDQETHSPVHTARDVREQRQLIDLHTARTASTAASTHIHARRATATGEQQQPWKVTLGARMQRRRRDIRA
jgi:hypothetical protein